MRDLREFAEEDRVIFTRHGVQVHPARPAIGGRGRLVEADVTRAPDAEDLQIDAAGITDGRFVVGAVLRGVLREAVRDVDVIRRDVEVTEEMLFHEEAVGLRMVRAEAFILVEVERDHRAEAHSVFAVQADEFRVEGQGRGACGQA